DRARPSYVGGILEMANARLYPFWGKLTQALKTGQPQNESQAGQNPFDALYADPNRLRQFLQGMTGLSMGVAREVARKFPWQNYRPLVDMGTAQGAFPVKIALAHPHLRGRGFALSFVGPIFQEYVASFGRDQRLKFQRGSFFTAPLPAADVLVMGHIL